MELLGVITPVYMPAASITKSTTQMEILAVSAFRVRRLSLPSLARKMSPENRLTSMATRKSMMIILINTIPSSLNALTWYQKLKIQSVTGIKFRSSLTKSLLMVAALLTLVSLGLWQLDRAEEKKQIRDQFLERVRLPAVPIGAKLLDADSMAFRNATATGRYIEDFQIFLDNKVHNGQAGYHVLTPVLLSGTSTMLLVNRGWIPWGADRQRLPEIETPDEQISITGQLIKPAQHVVSLENDAQIGDFHPLWQNLDVERYSRLTGYPVQRLVLRLAPGETEGGGFVRQWPRYQDSWVQRHQGYALQWFVLTIVLVCIFLFSSIKRES